MNKKNIQYKVESFSGMDPIEKGNSFFLTEQYDEAIEEFNKVPVKEIGGSVGKAKCLLQKLKLQSTNNELKKETFDKFQELANRNHFEGFFGLGNYYYLFEKWNEALAHFDQALNLNPNDYTCYIMKALTLEKLEKYKDAAKLFKEEIIEAKKVEMKKPESSLFAISNVDKKLRISNYDYWYKKAYDCYFQIKEYQKALECIQAAVKIDKLHIVYHCAQGRVFIKLNSYNAALECFEKSLQRSFSSDGICGKLTALRKLNRIKEAKSIINAIQRQQTNESTQTIGCLYFHKAKFYILEKKYDKALNNLDEAIRLNPDKLKYIATRAEIYFEKKEFDKSCQEYSKLVDRQYKPAAIRHRLGVSFYHNKQFEEALKNFEIARKGDEKNSKYHQWEGEAFHKLALQRPNEKFDEYMQNSIACLKKAIELDRSHVGCLKLLGDVYSDLGDYNKALEFYEDSLKLDASYYPALINKINCHNQLKDYAVANELCRRFPENRKEFLTAIWYRRGCSLFSLNQFEDALSYFEKVLKNEPQNFDAFHFKALTLEKLNRLKESASCFKEMRILFNPTDSINQIFQENMKRVQELYLKEKKETNLLNSFSIFFSTFHQLKEVKENRQNSVMNLRNLNGELVVSETIQTILQQFKLFLDQSPLFILPDMQSKLQIALKTESELGFIQEKILEAISRRDSNNHDLGLDALLNQRNLCRAKFVEAGNQMLQFFDQFGIKNLQSEYEKKWTELKDLIQTMENEYDILNFQELQEEESNKSVIERIKDTQAAWNLCETKMDEYLVKLKEETDLLELKVKQCLETFQNFTLDASSAELGKFFLALKQKIIEEREKPLISSFLKEIPLQQMYFILQNMMKSFDQAIQELEVASQIKIKLQQRIQQEQKYVEMNTLEQEEQVLERINKSLKEKQKEKYEQKLKQNLSLELIKDLSSLTQEKNIHLSKMQKLAWNFYPELFRKYGELNIHSMVRASELECFRTLREYNATYIQSEGGVEVFKGTWENGQCILKKYLLKNEKVFKKEVEIFHRLQHPNLLPIEAFFIEKDVKNSTCFGYVQLPFCELENIVIWRRNHTITEAQYKSVFREIAIVLAHLHENGILYGNINSKTILITKEGTSKLATFDFSKDLEERKQSILDDVTMWNPPEYREGKIFFSSDLYSLGSLMHEVYFPNHLSIDPQNIPPHENQDLRDLLLRLLKINPAERISAREAIFHPFFNSLEKYKLEVSREIDQLCEFYYQVLLKQKSIEEETVKLQLKKSELQKIEQKLKKEQESYLLEKQIADSLNESKRITLEKEISGLKTQQENLKSTIQAWKDNLISLQNESNSKLQKFKYERALFYKRNLFIYPPKHWRSHYLLEGTLFAYDRIVCDDSNFTDFLKKIIDEKVYKISKVERIENSDLWRYYHYQRKIIKEKTKSSNIRLELDIVESWMEAKFDLDLSVHECYLFHPVQSEFICQILHQVLTKILIFWS